MADTKINLGVQTDFTGGSNTLTCDLNPNVSGFQLVAQGFNWSAATVTVISDGTTDSETIDTSSFTAQKTIVIGPPSNAPTARVKSVTIGGLTAGTYKITVYQRG